VAAGWSDPARFRSLVEILDAAEARLGDKPLMGLATDQGEEQRWSAREFAQRSRLAAWRLRALGLQPGDRLLTWAPPGPDLAALIFGAIRAGVVLVPIDLRMTTEVAMRIGKRAEAGWLAVGTGRDAPDPAAAEAIGVPTITVERLIAERPGPLPPTAGSAASQVAEVAIPDDWQAQLAGWPPPSVEDLVVIIFTSGTTGHPKGVMLDHANILASMQAIDRIIPRREHRIVSLLPLSHLFGLVELFYALIAGAQILYLRSRTPRVIFDAIRRHSVTTMVVVPHLLQLFWSGIEREIAKQGQQARFERARRVARRMPYAVRRLIFRRVHQRLGGRLDLLLCSAAFLPPALQQAWEDLGIVVIQGYGATECGFATCNTLADHRPGQVGRTVPPVDLRLAAEDSQILVGGPTVFSGYWDDPAASAEALEEGWYRTGDVGRFDERGNLVLSGRTKNMIALPNGMKVFPEDIENALRVAGLQTVVVETEPGRIEAVVLASEPVVGGSPGSEAPELPEERIEAAVRAANATLGMHQRVAGWRSWPEADFPRTHTLKIRRDLVQAWAARQT
jgi:long-chain acyl-CoA synthetase